MLKGITCAAVVSNPSILDKATCINLKNNLEKGAREVWNRIGSPLKSGIGWKPPCFGQSIRDRVISALIHYIRNTVN